MTDQEFKALKFGEFIRLDDNRIFKVIDVIPAGAHASTTLVQIGSYVRAGAPPAMVPWKKLGKETPWLETAEKV
jgi:hypothetical protein